MAKPEEVTLPVRITVDVEQWNQVHANMKKIGEALAEATKAFRYLADAVKPPVE